MGKQSVYAPPIGGVMNRRKLLQLAASGVLIPTTFVACDGGGAEFVTTDDTGSTDTGASSDADTGSTTGACDTAAAASGPSDSHGHVVDIPAADLAAGAGGTYACTGGGHPHDVTLTSDDMATLLDTCTVTVSSDSGGHPHTWVITLPSL